MTNKKKAEKAQVKNYSTNDPNDARKSSLRAAIRDFYNANTSRRTKI